MSARWQAASSSISRRRLDQALHPGWAAQSGLRAALLGRAGFLGPRTVFEGRARAFHAFANTSQVDFAPLIADFGERWVTETLAFKLYPAGP